MQIQGIRVIEEDACTLFLIDSLSDELKEIIREQLQNIYHGFAEADSLPEFYSYEKTIASFLERYESKTENIKKGMIGELLSHILINKLKTQFTNLSILKNKEERSIKKGFDIIYCHLNLKSIWYCEVKSGNSTSQNSKTYNKILLDRAKEGIKFMFEEERNSLWESAQFDVNAQIASGKNKIIFKNLLANESPAIDRENLSKNVILISTLYHNLNDEIDIEDIKNYFEGVSDESIFNDVMIVSIQKETFEAVECFLEDEKS